MIACWRFLIAFISLRPWAYPTTFKDISGRFFNLDAIAVNWYFILSFKTCEVFLKSREESGQSMVVTGSLFLLLYSINAVQHLLRNVISKEVDCMNEV